MDGTITDAENRRSIQATLAINSGGGAVIQGSVNQTGGLLVGRDIIINTGGGLLNQGAWPGPAPAPARLRLFLGYDPADASAAALARAIAASLPAQQFEVLFTPPSAVASTHWRDDLYTVLGYVHAAVLLLSPSALHADVFFQAASLLATRLQLQPTTPAGQPSFPVQPVLLDGLTPEDVRNSPLTFLDLQTIPPLQTGAADEISAAVVNLVAPLQPARPIPPLVQVAQTVQALLQKSFPSDQWDWLIRQFIVWTPQDRPDLPLQAAWGLWRKELSDALLDYLGQHIQDDLSPLVEALVSTWVDPWTSRGIITVARRKAPPRAIGLAALGEFVSIDFVARSFWQRAYLLPPGTLLKVAGISQPDALSSLQDEVRAAVADYLEKKNVQVRTAQGIDPTVLRTGIRLKIPRPVCVVIPSLDLAPEALHTFLQTPEFQDLIFFFLSKTPLTPDQMAAYTDVLFLTPPLTAEQVENVAQVYMPYLQL